jgi:hypothetical protein
MRMVPENQRPRQVEFLCSISKSHPDDDAGVEKADKKQTNQKSKRESRDDENQHQNNITAHILEYHCEESIYGPQGMAFQSLRSMRSSTCMWINEMQTNSSSW